MFNYILGLYEVESMTKGRVAFRGSEFLTQPIRIASYHEKCVNHNNKIQLTRHDGTGLGTKS